MKTLLERQVLETIGGARMLSPGDRVAVAVSAGADSVALLRLLAGLRDELGITLLVAHFDHSLRGMESEGDAQFVAALSREHSFEYICDRDDVATAAARQGLNLEDAARRLRYAFFQRIVAQGRATRVAVAHTADDQAETVLARLFRGTGPAGLAGIHPVLGSIIRPLLAIRREQLREYLQGLGQFWREDLTNFDLSRQRAQLRAQLLPLIERDFSPKIVRHLSELARLAREEREFWDVLVEDRFRALVCQEGRQVTVQIDGLMLPQGLVSVASASPSGRSGPVMRTLTERLIRRLYEAVRGNCQDLSARHVEQVIHLATECASGSRIELPAGVVAERNFGSLVFSRTARAARRTEVAETAPPPLAYHYVASVPRDGVTAISVPELRARFLLKVIDWSSTERDTKLEDTLDIDLLSNTLTLRNWQPGDAYRPRGHRQERKLKQLFLARRVPRCERAHWPVIECGGSIVWARGMPLASDFCAGEGTRVGLRIEEDRL
ncbi:MAG: tRNA lysidine(34) synthetase TilS [Candidatus Acidiferrales bacterium]|jgi:tRNA(Ile)-lysidine synthase